MRTRSQQASPGGFVSLENERTVRRTRSNRSTSQEPSSSTTAQTATRSKSQRTNKKPGPKKSTATKTQNRKVTKRVTRKTTRKTDQATSGGEDVESHDDELRKESPKETAEDGPEDSQSTTVLSEPKTSERKLSNPIPSSENAIGPTDTPQPLDSPSAHLFSPLSITPPDLSTLGLSWLEYLGEISDIGSPLSELSRTPSIDGSAFDFHSDWDLDSEPKKPYSQSCVASETKDVTSPDVPGEPHASEPSDAKATTPESESVAAEKPADQVTSTEYGYLTPPVDAVEDSVAIDEIDELAERFKQFTLRPCSPAAGSSAELLPKSTRLRDTQQPAKDINASAGSPTSVVSPKIFNNQAAVVEGAAAEIPRRASIFDDNPPYFDTEAWSRVFSPPPVRAQAQLQDEVQAPQCLSMIFGPVPSGPTSIFEGGRAASYLGDMSERRPTVERPSTPVQTIKSRGTRTRLSPIPEEPGLSPRPGSSANEEQEGNASISASRFPLSAAAQRVYQEIPQENSPIIPERPRGGNKKKRRKKNKKLIPKKVNRKRSRSNVSNDDPAVPETPPANKRRNLGTPGSTPFARRLTTPLSRRLSTNAVPYSERLRRRAVESQGRIDRTVFRIPELIAQTEADRRASESPSSSPFPDQPTTSFDFTVERVQTDDENLQNEESSASQESSNPETPRRGWNIRGLLSSVPRSLSISRFLPTFGRSPSTTETSGPAQPSSERITRTQPREVGSSTSRMDSQTRRRLSESTLSEERPKKRSRNMSYSLFPAPMDKSLYLGDIPKTSTEIQKASSMDSELHTTEKNTMDKTAEASQSKEPTISDSQVKTTDDRRETRAQETAQPDKKRKRAPSPDVIPNPVGSSYGMDLDYFCYSSDSDEEASKKSSQDKDQEPQSLSLAKTAVRSAIRSERHPSKKVRFDASPEDTPSKKRMRARATDPYDGQHFVGMGSSSPTPASASSTPVTPSPSARDKRSSNFIPNSQGTFQLDYDDDAPDDSSESSGAPSSTPPAVAPLTPSSTSEKPASTQVEKGDKALESPQSSLFGTPQPAAPPSTPAGNPEALARARLQAEKYKPKTPSGLRTTSRYSSPLNVTPDNLAHQKQPAEKFGDDQFARDAQWLYENCPSGDLKELVWPAKPSLRDEIDDNTAPFELMSKLMEATDKEAAHQFFKRQLNEFENAIA